MTDKLIIVINGFAGTGKDSIGDVLVDSYGFFRNSFAKEMKETVIRIFDFPREHVFGPSHLREVMDKRYPFTGTCPWCHEACYHDPEGVLNELKYWFCPVCSQRLNEKVQYPRYVNPRLALTTLGTEWGRTLYDAIWPVRTFAEIANCPPDVDRHVITDLRYRNEFDTARRSGAFIVRVKRPGVGPKSTHTSETEQLSIADDEFDCIINNDGTLQDLQDKAHELFMTSYSGPPATRGAPKIL